MSHCVRIWNITPENYEIRFNLPPNCGFPDWIFTCARNARTVQAHLHHCALNRARYILVCAHPQCAGHRSFILFLLIFIRMIQYNRSSMCYFWQTLPTTHCYYKPAMANHILMHKITSYTNFHDLYHGSDYSLGVRAQKRIRLAVSSARYSFPAMTNLAKNLLRHYCGI